MAELLLLLPSKVRSMLFPKVHRNPNGLAFSSQSMITALYHSNDRKTEKLFLRDLTYPTMNKDHLSEKTGLFRGPATKARPLWRRVTKALEVCDEGKTALRVHEETIYLEPGAGDSWATNWEPETGSSRATDVALGSGGSGVLRGEVFQNKTGNNLNKHDTILF